VLKEGTTTAGASGTGKGLKQNSLAKAAEWPAQSVQPCPLHAMAKQLIG